jgi:hypothetical protein
MAPPVFSKKLATLPRRNSRLGLPLGFVTIAYVFAAQGIDLGTADLEQSKPSEFAIPRMAGHGASRPLPWVTAKVTFLITLRAFSGQSVNWPSCP